MDHPLPDIVAIGGAHLDRRARLSGPHRPRTSNPGRMIEEVGGGAFNALRAARLFGPTAALASARGADAAGAAVADEMRRRGVADLSQVYIDRPTPSYTAILDHDGELVTAVADMAVYDKALPRAVSSSRNKPHFAAAKVVLCDANMPETAIADLLGRIAAPVHAMAISAAKATRLVPSLARLACVCMNRHEAAALTGLATDADAGALATALVRLGLGRGVVSAGPEPAIVIDAGRAALALPPVPDAVVDVTGAGDALAGAVLAGEALGIPFRDAVRNGLALASLVVALPGCAPLVTLSEITRRASTITFSELPS